MEKEITMHCPSCKTKLSEKDFDLTVHQDVAELVVECPKCERTYIIGFFSQADLED